MMYRSPSKLAMVPFVSVENMMNIIRDIGVETLLLELSHYIEEDFKRWEQFDRTPRVASHSDVGVIELMPTADSEIYSFKYVNGHPKNQAEGFQTVTAFGVLSNVNNGYPVLLSEMTILTALRTAATSALMAKYLAPKSSKVMGMIGNGAQCEFQALAFKKICGVETVKLYDIDPAATEKAATNLRDLGLNVIPCSTAKAAVEGVDIITTCTADKRYATILTDDMVPAGVHVNAIGGDCPGKTELQKEILQRSDIFVEYTPQTRIEGDIQQLDKNHPVTEMWQVITGQAEGRQTADQITVFDGVGFATEDFSALRYIRAQLERTGHYVELDFLADPVDTRNLFGMVQKYTG
ncbi:ornithine cyclodeaminase [Oceanisphaera psychrotolerans]|uniref:Ornithine cyclodeaminase n=1 Tax=Oceanisphaera psychrotolerans TaxID=1414654 RepID=A0A1J4QB63_9GAMM|nr:ornithine cyclodeaminase [Oceanisphaera psychrotolerans]OIN06591.1 ornithine cyclodeaminase [Oceanisphaera psychrotolerans]